jgi:ABC-type amino acid transport substrate-binding protein
MTVTSFARRVPLRAIVVALLLLVLAVRLAGHARPDGSLQRVQQAGVLVVALDASYPPFETTDGQGNFGGFDADLARAIASGLGVKVQFADISFDSLYDALAAHKADVVISGLRYEAERTRDVMYTAPYFDAGQVIVVRASDAFAKPADLAGRRVGVETASEGDVEARKLAAKVAGMQLVSYDSPDEAMAALQSRAVDGAVTDYVTALELTKSQDGLRIMLPPFAPDPLVIAGRAGDRTLMAEIGRILKGLQADGTLSRLTDQM